MRLEDNKRKARVCKQQGDMVNDRIQKGARKARNDFTAERSHVQGDSGKGKPVLGAARAGSSARAESGSRGFDLLALGNAGCDGFSGQGRQSSLSPPMKTVEQVI